MSPKILSPGLAAVCRSLCLLLAAGVAQAQAEGISEAQRVRRASAGIPAPLELEYGEKEQLGSSPYRASRLWLEDYSRRFVQIESDGILLSCAMYFPGLEPGKRVPAIVLAHGSGPTTQYNMGYYVYLGLKMGAAVLACDKRGVGNSEGDYDYEATVSEPEVVFKQLASDLVAQLKWAKTQPEIDTARIGMMGPSQAGWIMPLAANADDGFNFIVSLSGPAVSVGEENFFSTLTNESNSPEGLSIAEADKRLAEFDGAPGFDPLPALKELRANVLWQFGDHDRSVPVDESIRRLKGLNKQNFEIVVVPDVGHGSANIYTGEYEDFVQVVRPWLVKIGVFER